MSHFNKQLQFLPDFGRPNGCYAPVSIDHLHRDTEEEEEVFLRVTANGDVDPHTNHWAICWVVGAINTSKETIPVLRILQIVREINVDHLTNWGPMTKTLASDPDVANGLEIPLASLTLAQRKALEVIAEAKQVRVPDGQWNCQDWVVTVLELAERQGLIPAALWTSALEKARTFGRIADSSVATNAV